MRALRDALGTDPAKLLGVGGAALDAAVEADRRVRRAPTMAAIERFTGVLYEALDAASLRARERRRLDESVVILSGLFGALAPSDPIPDHRLKMSAALPELGRLSTWWRPHLDAALEPLVRGATVWDLLPTEHAAALTVTRTEPARRIVVRFLDDVERDGSRRLVTVSHWNKLLKGSLVRHLLSTGLDDPDGLRRFDHPQGHAHRPELTTVDGTTTTVSMVAAR
jgi:cytoplasmic iron level regulating protein YaaA (DUF328/UPF0246 family)